MSWFLVRARCVGPSIIDPREAFYDLDDDTTVFVDLSALDTPVVGEQKPLELRVAVDAADPDAAAAHVRELLVEDPDFELLDVVEVTETTNPRALSPQVQAVLREAADELRDELREDLEVLRGGEGYELTFTVRQHLPAGFARHYTPELVAQWAGSVETVAHKLAAYPATYLASTAEELAGHALIERCQALVDEREDELDDPEALREKLSRCTTSPSRTTTY